MKFMLSLCIHFQLIMSVSKKLIELWSITLLRFVQIFFETDVILFSIIHATSKTSVVSWKLKSVCSNHLCDLFFQIIISFILILVTPMYLSSSQTAIEAPGLPFGCVDLPKDWTRTFLQLMMILFSPLTILMLRLQYELTLARWQLGKELHKENLIEEFGHLSLLLKVS